MTHPYRLFKSPVTSALYGSHAVILLLLSLVARQTIYIAVFLVQFLFPLKRLVEDEVDDRSEEQAGAASSSSSSRKRPAASGKEIPLNLMLLIHPRHSQVLVVFVLVHLVWCVVLGSMLTGVDSWRVYENQPVVMELFRSVGVWNPKLHWGLFSTLIVLQICLAVSCVLVRQRTESILEELALYYEGGSVSVSPSHSSEELSTVAPGREENAAPLLQSSEDNEAANRLEGKMYSAITVGSILRDFLAESVDVLLGGRRPATLLRRTTRDLLVSPCCHDSQSPAKGGNNGEYVLYHDLPSSREQASLQVSSAGGGHSYLRFRYSPDRLVLIAFGGLVSSILLPSCVTSVFFALFFGVFGTFLMPRKSMWKWFCIHYISVVCILIGVMWLVVLAMVLNPFVETIMSDTVREVLLGTAHAMLWGSSDLGDNGLLSTADSSNSGGTQRARDFGASQTSTSVLIILHAVVVLHLIHVCRWNVGCWMRRYTTVDAQRAAKSALEKVNAARRAAAVRLLLLFAKGNSTNRLASIRATLVKYFFQYFPLLLVPLYWIISCTILNIVSFALLCVALADIAIPVATFIKTLPYLYGIASMVAIVTFVSLISADVWVNDNTPGSNSGSLSLTERSDISPPTVMIAASLFYLHESFPVGVLELGLQSVAIVSMVFASLVFKRTPNSNQYLHSKDKRYQIRKAFGALRDRIPELKDTFRKYCDSTSALLKSADELTLVIQSILDKHDMTAITATREEVQKIWTYFNSGTNLLVKGRKRSDMGGVTIGVNTKTALQRYRTFVFKKDITASHAASTDAVPHTNGDVGKRPLRSEGSPLLEGAAAALTSSFSLSSSKQLFAAARKGTEMTSDTQIGDEEMRRIDDGATTKSEEGPSGSSGTHDKEVVPEVVSTPPLPAANRRKAKSKAAPSSVSARFTNDDLDSGSKRKIKSFRNSAPSGEPASPTRRVRFQDEPSSPNAPMPKSPSVPYRNVTSGLSVLHTTRDDEDRAVAVVVEQDSSAAISSSPSSGSYSIVIDDEEELDEFLLEREIFGSNYNFFTSPTESTLKHSRAEAIKGHDGRKGYGTVTVTDADAECSAHTLQNESSVMFGDAHYDDADDDDDDTSRRFVLKENKASLNASSEGMGVTFHTDEELPDVIIADRVTQSLLGQPSQMVESAEDSELAKGFSFFDFVVLYHFMMELKHGRPKYYGSSNPSSGDVNECEGSLFEYLQDTLALVQELILHNTRTLALIAMFFAATYENELDIEHGIYIFMFVAFQAAPKRMQSLWPLISLYASVHICVLYVFTLTYNNKASLMPDSPALKLSGISVTPPVSLTIYLIVLAAASTEARLFTNRQVSLKRIMRNVQWRMFSAARLTLWFECYATLSLVSVAFVVVVLLEPRSALVAGFMATFFLGAVTGGAPRAVRSAVWSFQATYCLLALIFTAAFQMPNVEDWVVKVLGQHLCNTAQYSASSCFAQLGFLNRSKNSLIFILAPWYLACVTNLSLFRSVNEWSNVRETLRQDRSAVLADHIGAAKAAFDPAVVLGYRVLEMCFNASKAVRDLLTLHSFKLLWISLVVAAMVRNDVVSTLFLALFLADRRGWWVVAVSSFTLATLYLYPLYFFPSLPVDADVAQWLGLQKITLSETHNSSTGDFVPLLFCFLLSFFEMRTRKTDAQIADEERFSNKALTTPILQLQYEIRTGQPNLSPPSLPCVPFATQPQSVVQHLNCFYDYLCEAFWYDFSMEIVVVCVLVTIAVGCSRVTGAIGFALLLGLWAVGRVRLVTHPNVARAMLIILGVIILFLCLARVSLPPSLTKASPFYRPDCGPWAVYFGCGIGTADIVMLCFTFASLRMVVAFVPIARSTIFSLNSHFTLESYLKRHQKALKWIERLTEADVAEIIPSVARPLTRDPKTIMDVMVILFLATFPTALISFLNGVAVPSFVGILEVVIGLGLLALRQQIMWRFYVYWRWISVFFFLKLLMQLVSELPLDIAALESIGWVRWSNPNITTAIIILQQSNVLCLILQQRLFDEFFYAHEMIAQHHKLMSAAEKNVAISLQMATDAFTEQQIVKRDEEYVRRKLEELKAVRRVTVGFGDDNDAESDKSKRLLEMGSVITSSRKVSMKTPRAVTPGQIFGGNVSAVYAALNECECHHDDDDDDDDEDSSEEESEEESGEPSDDNKPEVPDDDNKPSSAVPLKSAQDPTAAESSVPQVPKLELGNIKLKRSSTSLSDDLAPQSHLGDGPPGADRTKSRDSAVPLGRPFMFIEPDDDTTGDMTQRDDNDDFEEVASPTPSDAISDENQPTRRVREITLASRIRKIAVAIRKSSRELIAYLVKHTYTRHPPDPDQTFLYQLISVLLRVGVKKSQYLVFTLCTVNFAVSGTMSDMIMCLAAFLYGMLIHPWADAFFWNALLIYNCSIVVLKAIIETVAGWYTLSYNAKYWVAILALDTGVFFGNDTSGAMLVDTSLTFAVFAAIILHRQLSLDHGVFKGALGYGSNVTGGLRTFTSWARFSAAVESTWVNVTTRQGSGKDYYTPLFCSHVLIGLLVVLMYYPLAGQVRGSIVEGISQDLLPGPAVVLLLAVVLLISVERIVYITGAIRCKVLLYVVQVLVYCCGLVAWNVNVVTSDKTPGIVLYLALMLSCAISALQVREGFPIHRRHDPFTSSTSIFSSAGFTVFRFIPFCFELRLLLDWSFTKTSLKLADWMFIEDVHTEVYLRYVDIADGKKTNPRRGMRFPWFEKMYQGFLGFAVVLSILFFPLLYYSTYNPSLQQNSVTFLRTSVEFQDITEVFRSEDHETVLPATFTTDVELTRPLLAQYRLFQDRNVQLLKHYRCSSTTWTAPPETRVKLQQTVREALNALNSSQFSSDPFNIVTTWEIHRAGAAADSATNLNLQDTYTVPPESLLALNNALLSMSDPSQTTSPFSSVVPLPKFYSPFLENRPSVVQTMEEFTGDNVITELNKVDCNLTLHNTLDPVTQVRVIYWCVSCGTLFSSGNVPTANASLFPENACFQNPNTCALYDFETNPPAAASSALYYVIASDHVASSSQYFASFGIVALYTTFILAIGSVLRNAVTGSSHKTIVGQLCDPTPIAAWLQCIYMARLAAARNADDESNLGGGDENLMIEEDLFNELVDLLRSPEMVIRLTGLHSDAA